MLFLGSFGEKLGSLRIILRDNLSLRMNHSQIIGCQKISQINGLLIIFKTFSRIALNAIAREINQPKIERRHGIALISGQFVIFHSFAKVAVCAFALIRKNSNIILAFRIARSCSL